MQTSGSGERGPQWQGITHGCGQGGYSVLGLIPIPIDVDIPTTGNQGTDRAIIRSN